MSFCEKRLLRNVAPNVSFMCCFVLLVEHCLSSLCVVVLTPCTVTISGMNSVTGRMSHCFSLLILLKLISVFSLPKCLGYEVSGHLGPSAEVSFRHVEMFWVRSVCHSYSLIHSCGVEVRTVFDICCC